MFAFPTANVAAELQQGSDNVSMCFCARCFVLFLYVYIQGLQFAVSYSYVHQFFFFSHVSSFF